MCPTFATPTADELPQRCAVIERSLDPSLRIPELYYDRDIPAAEYIANVLSRRAEAS